MTRKKLEALAWKHIGKDYKGVWSTPNSTFSIGTKTIMTYRDGTCLVALADATDAELIAKIPSKVYAAACAKEGS